MLQKETRKKGAECGKIYAYRKPSDAEAAFGFLRDNEQMVCGADERARSADLRVKKYMRIENQATRRQHLVFYEYERVRNMEADYVKDICCNGEKCIWKGHHI